MPKEIKQKQSANLKHLWNYFLDLPLKPMKGDVAYIWTRDKINK